MKKSWWFGLCTAALSCLLWAAAAPDAASLTRQEALVLEHLRADWGKQYRTTSVPVAAKSMRLRLSDESRLRLSRFLETHRSEFIAPGRHGITTVVLAPQEKLIARALLLREIRGGSTARADDVAAETQLPLRQVSRGLEFLRQLDVVVADGEGKNRHYRVAERFPRRPSPRIDFYSHLVEVNGHDPFEVA